MDLLKNWYKIGIKVKLVKNLFCKFLILKSNIFIQNVG